MTRIGLLHPGEMGAAVGAALVAIGHEVVWVPRGRSAETRRRAETAGLTEVVDVSDCTVILSIVPPAFAVETASGVARIPGVYVDANAINPDTAERVASVVSAKGGTFVDGGIIGPPPRGAGTTRLYLSGPGARGVADCFAGSLVDARVLTDGGPTAASALKMTYGAWTKIAAALLLSIRSTAEATGVAEALEAEWLLSAPDLAARLESARRSAEAKGWRWTEEMHQIGGTFDRAGQPSGFGDAAAQVFSRYPRP
jgi:3-hydroxyisobutyrate dehydrogenase-like beta-hydroxyacid dehydrogenase